MRSEYPSGLVIGPGIWRSPVRFPAPRRSFRSHFFVNFGMSWDLSRSGLGTFSHGFGILPYFSVYFYIGASRLVVFRQAGKPSRLVAPPVAGLIYLQDLTNKFAGPMAHSVLDKQQLVLVPSPSVLVWDS